MVFEPSYEDPANVILGRIVTPLANQFVRSHLKLRRAQYYQHFNREVNKTWVWRGRSVRGGESLANCLRRNPQLRVYVCSGYYDLAVPTAVVDFDLGHLQIPETCKKLIRHDRFAAGHMMYVEAGVLSELSNGIAEHLGWQ